MTILITAATGTVGAPLTRALARSGHPVRAFVRDPGRARAVLGDEVALSVGDLADRSSLERALVGVDRVFLACGNVPDQVSHECEAVDAAARAGVDLVVKLSAPHADLRSPLLLERWHGQIENHLRHAGLPAVLLRPRPFMTNLLASADLVARTGVLAAPAGTARVGFVDPRDVAASAAAALTDHARPGTYALSGPVAVTHDEIADLLSTVSGRPVRYVPLGDAEAREAFVAAGLPPAVADSLVGFYASLRAGSMSVPTRGVEQLTGRVPRSLEEFLREHAAAFASGEPQPVGP